MVPNLPIKRFRSGEVIFSEGDAPASVFVIINGHVEITRGEKVIASLGEDDVFGDMALITNSPRSATARASSNTSCYEICLEAFKQQVDNASPMIQAILKILCQRLRESKEG